MFFLKNIRLIQPCINTKIKCLTEPFLTGAGKPGYYKDFQLLKKTYQHQ